VLTIVGGLEIAVDEEKCAERCGQVEYFHERVVHRDEIDEEVHVPDKKYESVQDLSFARYAFGY
jgi:hypothetical protein